MHGFLVLSTALAFSWFGQLPPHGEVERDLLTFLLFGMATLWAGWKTHVAAQGRAPVAGGASWGRQVIAFLLVWLVLLLLIGLQWAFMPPEVWSGRQWMTMGWLLSAWAAVMAGGIQAAPDVSGMRTSQAAWRWIALGLVVAAMVNGMVAWLQVVLGEALPAWLPASQAPGRGYGALLQPNLTATLLVIGLISLESWSDSRAGHTKRRHWFGAAVALFLGSAIAVTGSRIGLLLLLLWCAVQAWNARSIARSVWAGWPLLGLGLVFLLAGLGFGGGEVVTALDRGVGLSNGRTLIFSNALSMGAAFPWTGAGFNQFSFWHAELPYQPKMMGYLTHAHNLFLQFWAEMGLAGLLWVLVAMGVLLWPLRTWRRTPVDRRPEAQRWALGVLAVLCLHAMTELPLWSAPFLLLFAFAAGLWLVPSVATHTSVDVPVHRVGKLATIWGLLTVMAASWVYSDYLKVSALYAGARWPVVPSESAPQRAASSLLFRPAAEFAAANSATVDGQTVDAYTRTLPVLWRYVTDERMYEWQLRTDAWNRDVPGFAYHAQRFRWLYPQAYETFQARVRAEDGHPPWTGFSPQWP